MNKRSGIRNLSLFVLAFVILLNSVSAVPPVQIASNPTNLQIAYPQYPSVQQNRGFTLITSVINETHQKTNLTTTCILHLQNPDGGETCHSKMSYSIADEHFEVDVSEGNFSAAGYHAFFIICNSSTQVGFANGIFEATPTGEDPNSGLKLFVIILSTSFVLLVLSLIFKDHILLFFSGIGFVVGGLYAMINGLGTSNLLYSRMFAVIIIGLGLVQIISTSVTELKHIEGNSSKIEDGRDDEEDSED